MRRLYWIIWWGLSAITSMFVSEGEEEIAKREVMGQKQRHKEKMLH